MIGEHVYYQRVCLTIECGPGENEPDPADWDWPMLLDLHPSAIYKVEASPVRVKVR